LIMTSKKLNCMAMALTAALAVGVSLSESATAGGPRILQSGDVDSMARWQGRGAGLEGADRIAYIGTPSTAQKPVTVTYDRVVVERTNMRRAEAPDNTTVGIVFDREVMARTNMPGAFEDLQPSKSAAAPGPVVK
jgi:hypothetical protein